LVRRSDAVAFGYCADVDVAEIDMPAVGAIRALGAGKVGNVLLKRAGAASATSYRGGAKPLVFPSAALRPTRERRSPPDRHNMKFQKPNR
jgi:hypothetical protein